MSILKVGSPDTHVPTPSIDITGLHNGFDYKISYYGCVWTVSLHDKYNSCVGFGSFHDFLDAVQFLCMKLKGV